MGVLHYAGRIDWDGGWVLPGWAACCSGEQAVKIREQGRNTFDRDQVTCKRCLKMIAKHDARAERLAAEKETT